MHSYDHRFPPQYYIDRVSAISSNLFCTGYFTHPDNEAQHCFNGHLGVREAGGVTLESAGLFLILQPLTIHRIKSGREVVESSSIGFEGLPYSNKAAVINNGDAIEYQQATPKERVLAALYDAKAWWDNYEQEQQTQWAVDAVKDHLATTPVKHRSMATIFASIIIIFSLLLLGSCVSSKQSGGCHATRGKVGY